MLSRTQVSGGEASAADAGRAAAVAASAPVAAPHPAVPVADGISDEERRAFFRAENEDDDGYDPYSDRRPMPEPLFERDPWG